MESQSRISRIDDLTRAFNETFGALTAEKLNWKPDPQVWSIAQNIDHLITINETYFPVIGAIRTGDYRTPLIGKLGFIVRFFGKTVLRSVQPDRRRKIKTFPVWEPSSSLISGDILDRFGKHQEELKAMMERSGDLLEKGTVISSPANKYVVYTLEQAFDIIVAHEQRHLEQAKELLAELEKLPD